MCREVKERHFACNIKDWIQDSKNLFHINDEQIFAVSIDSAANITKAIDDLIVDMNKESNEILATEGECDGDVGDASHVDASHVNRLQSELVA